MPDENSQNGTSTERGELVVDVLRRMYTKLDPIAAGRAEKMKSTCTKGCNHCCMLLTSMVFSEGLVVADKLIETNEWRAYLPRLHEAAQAHCYHGLSKATYFSKKRQCVFLSAGGLCNIYDVRPSCCRYHYVISDPAECSPHKRDGRTGIVDNRDIEESVWELDKYVSLEMFGTPMMAAPIPLMVLFCLFVASEGNEQMHKEVKKWTRGLPNPMEWLKTYGFEMIVTDGELEQEAASRLKQALDSVG